MVEEPDYDDLDDPIEDGSLDVLSRILEKLGNLLGGQGTSPQQENQETEVEAETAQVSLLEKIATILSDLGRKLTDGAQSAISGFVGEDGGTEELLGGMAALLAGQGGQGGGGIPELLSSIGGGKELPDGSTLGEKMEMVPDAIGAASGDPQAIARIIEKTLGKMQKRMEEMQFHASRIGQEGKNMVSPGSFENKGESAFKAMESAANLAGPMGKTVEPVTKFGQQLFKSLDRLKKWTDSLHQANMQFAEFSGEMRAVQVERQAQEMWLGKQAGDARAESAKMLSDEKMRWAAKTQPIENFLANVGNYIGFGLEKLKNEALDVATLGLLPDAPEIGEGLNEWMDRVAEEEDGASWEDRPKRFQ